MKPVGKPDAGNRHVRFDERGWETGRWPKAQATAPILDSTQSSHGLSLTGRGFCATWRGRVADLFVVVLDWDGRVIGNTLRMYSASILQNAVA